MSGLLADIIDYQNFSFDAVLAWLNRQIATIQQAKFTPELLQSFTAFELQDDFDHPLGAEASPVWRKFFLATLLADWVTYPRDIDRADFARLKYILTSSYKTFRLWFCRLPDGAMMPVGYTAWYPVAEFVYEGVLRNPAGIQDRGIFMPLRNADSKNCRYAYAFNISIVESLRRTACNLRLIKACQRDLETTLKQAHVMVTVVGEGGAKFLRLMDFERVGALTIGGEPEDLFVRKPLYF